MTATLIDTVVRRRLDALVAELRAAGAIRSPEWAQVFASVPRHVFVPRLYEQDTDARGIAVWRPVDEGDEEWLEAVYADRTLVTSLDPATAAPTGDGGFTGMATSSSTLPSLMARMLEDLDIGPGQRMLEIGTGTGYNTALLAARLGEDQVYSVDIDPALIEAAHTRLALLGAHPHLSTADGRAGLSSGAPFDRIIATCSVPSIPAAWLHQARQGTLILTDLATGIEGGLIRLTVISDRQAEGWFTSTTGRFMPARHHERTYQRLPMAPYAATIETRPSPVRAADINAHYPFRLLLALRLPESELVYHLDDHTGAMALQLQHPDGSWARCPLPGQPSEGTVNHGGPTDLWRQVEDNWQWWTDRDRPDQTRFGLTITSNGTQAWWQPHDDTERFPLD